MPNQPTAEQQCLIEEMADLLVTWDVSQAAVRLDAMAELLRENAIRRLQA